MTSITQPPVGATSPASSSYAHWSVVLTDASGTTTEAQLISLDGVVDQSLILQALDQLDSVVPDSIPPPQTA